MAQGMCVLIVTLVHTDTHIYTVINFFTYISLIISLLLPQHELSQFVLLSKFPFIFCLNLPYMAYPMFEFRLSHLICHIELHCIRIGFSLFQSCLLLTIAIIIFLILTSRKLNLSALTALLGRYW